MVDDIEIKRAYVTGLYPGPGWEAKVRKMPDAQVIAIYLREQAKPKEPNKESGSESGGDDIPF